MSYLKPRNLLLVLALGLALTLLVVIYLRFRPENQLQSMVEALPKGIDVALQDIDYTHLENGHARWRLVAQQVEHLSSSKTLVINNPHLTFYDEEGGTQGTIQAGSGEVSRDYQRVRLRDDVILKNPEGYTLYTDLLYYDHESQTATTDSHVRLVSDGVLLEGNGLEYHMQEERLKLNADVTATF
jgi:LPS export ABC transporter protein LptC